MTMTARRAEQVFPGHTIRIFPSNLPFHRLP
jgi:hypothetical protein